MSISVDLPAQGAGDLPASGGGGSSSGSGSVGPLAPAFPYATDFANASKWTIENGLWVLAPNTNAAVPDVKTNYAQLGGASLANSSALSSASYTGGVLTWAFSAVQDWASSGGTSALLYWTVPAGLLWDDIPVIAIRIVTPVGIAETGYFGGMVALESSPTLEYLRFVQGYISGAHNGYSQVQGAFGSSGTNYTLSQTDQEAGVWHRVMLQPNGSLIYQTSPVSTDSYDVAAGVGTWTTQRSSSASAFTAATTLRVGLFGGKGATATLLTFTGRQLTTRTTARNYGRGSLPGFGLPRSRTVTPIPILTANIGSSATYSDTEIIARLAASVNKRSFDSATVRAYVQRGADYATPADGAAGWVTYSGGTFSGLATVGTGDRLSIWLDVASSNGSQHASFDPHLFGALGLS